MSNIPENFTDSILVHGARRPDSPALIEGADTLSYGELAALVRKASVYLCDLGLAPGDRVGIALPNTADHVILGLGLMRMGAVPVEMPPYLPPEHYGKFDLTKIFIAAAAPAPDGIPAVRVDAGWRELVQSHEGDRRRGGGEDELYFIFVTSGSTGIPKGVVVSQRRATISYRIALQLYPDIYSEARPAHFLLTGAIANAGFFKAMRTQLYIGGPVVLLPEFSVPAGLIEAIAGWDDSLALVTPKMCRDFIDAAPSEGLLFPRARALIGGGQASFAGDKCQMIERVTPRFYDNYGAAAFGTIARLAPEEMPRYPDSVGRAAPEAEIEIVDAAGKLQPPGRAGHLRCRGPTVASRFYGEDGFGRDDGERFRDGWYYPGDLAAMDEDGYITLKGRQADIILRQGIEILPQEIEEVMTTYPGVADAAVVGRPLAGRDPEIVAYVVARGPLDHAALAQHCATELAPARRPDRIFYIDALPKTPAGKVSRMALRQYALTR